MKNEACRLRDDFLRLASRFQAMKADNREDWVRYLRNASAGGIIILKQASDMGLVRKWYIPEIHHGKTMLDDLLNEVYLAEGWYMTFGIIEGEPRKTAKRYAMICRKLARAITKKLPEIPS
jgi:hypothetical protein